MSEKLKKVKLKGNESFNFREGWLRKGMRCVEADGMVFSQDDAMEQLGVGSKMVKSIRFWLQATYLCEERIVNPNRARVQFLTDSFGRLIYSLDPYFDDPFTLFLIHYHLVKNEEFCIVWNLFFNEYNGQDFLKDDFVNSCAELLDKRMDEGCEYSRSLMEDDCASVIKMYTDENKNVGGGAPTVCDNHPEESLLCPLVELGLIRRSSKRKGAYIKSSPTRESLDKLAVLYVIVNNMIENRKNSVGIGDLLNAHNNIGRVFNLNRVLINEYLDQLRIAEYLTINRTAGLDMVYLRKEISPESIIREYFEKVKEK